MSSGAARAAEVAGPGTGLVVGQALGGWAAVAGIVVAVVLVVARVGVVGLGFWIAMSCPPERQQAAMKVLKVLQHRHRDQRTAPPPST